MLEEKRISVSGAHACSAAAPSAIAHFGRFLVLAAACLIFAVAFAFMRPGTALAAGVSYTIDQVKIDAQVQSDATLRLVEHRVLTYSAAGTVYFQQFPWLAENSSLVINDMRVAKVDADGTVAGDWARLHPVAFQREWRKSVPADTLEQLLSNEGSYAYDPSKHGFYLYFQAEAGDRFVVELDYSVVNGAQAYADVADVTFKYVDDSVETASNNVTFTLSLPVPDGATAVPDDNVFAWGHGPAGGEIANLGSTIVYTVDRVNAGQYAEANVTFPVSWLTHLTGTDALIHRDEVHLPWVKKAEASWVDTFRNAAINDDRFNIAVTVASLIVLAAALAVLMRYRRDPDPAPEAAEPAVARGALHALHPAVAVRFMNDGAPSDREFVATLVRLRDAGEIAVSEGAQRVGRTFFGFAEDPLDEGALEIFGVLDGGGQGIVRASQIADAAAANERAFLDAAKWWEEAADTAYAAAGFVDPRAARASKRLRIGSGVYAVAALLVMLFTTCVAGGLLILATALVMFGTGHATQRLSQKGADTASGLEALRDAALAGEVQLSALDGYVLGVPLPKESYSTFAFIRTAEQAIPRAFKAAQQTSSTIFSRTHGRASRLMRRLRITCKKLQRKKGGRRKE